MNIFLLLAGCAFASLGCFIMFDYYRFNHNALKTQGKILRYDQYQSKDTDNRTRTMYRPIFELTINGQSYEIKSKVSFGSKIIPVGHNTAIFYHKGDEENARLAEGNGFGLGILFIGLAIPAIYIGVG